MAVLGGLLLALGKGLVNRNQAAWRWALAIMVLVLINNLILESQDAFKLVFCAIWEELKFSS